MIELYDKICLEIRNKITYKLSDMVTGKQRPQARVINVEVNNQVTNEVGSQVTNQLRIQISSSEKSSEIN